MGAGKRYVPTETSVKTNNQVVRASVVGVRCGFVNPSYRLSTMGLVPLLERNVGLASSERHPLNDHFPDIDQVTLGGFVIGNQSIGVASSARGFRSIDGILGCVDSRILKPDPSLTPFSPALDLLI